MECVICREDIENFHPDIHTMKIDDDRSVNICSKCTDRFIRWQQMKFSKLFPTRSAKKLSRNE